MYEGDIIDSHMHLWDIRNHYAWLNEPDNNLEKMLGDYTSLRKNFLAPKYIKLAKENNIKQSVCVEAFGFPQDPSMESNWMQKQADEHGFPNGIVSYAKLDKPDVEQLLIRHIENTNVRGIRMVLNWHDLPHMRMTDRPDYMIDQKWLDGFSLLSKYNLSFDLQIFDHQLVEAKQLAKDFPNTQIILEHLAWPTDFSSAGFLSWKKNIASIAECDNVVIKLSCFGCAFQKKLSHHTIKKYIKTAIDVFTPDRCMFGSNFPPDSLFLRLNEMIKLLKDATSDLTDDEQRKLFFNTAQRIYRLDS